MRREKEAPLELGRGDNGDNLEPLDRKATPERDLLDLQALPGLAGLLAAMAFLG